MNVLDRLGQQRVEARLQQLDDDGLAESLDLDRVMVARRGEDARRSWRKPRNRPTAHIVGARNLALRLLIPLLMMGERRHAHSAPIFKTRLTLI